MGKMISVEWLTFFHIIIHFFFCSCDISFYHEHKDTPTSNFSPEPAYNQLNLADAKNFFDRKNCGKSLKHLGGLLLDKSDKESKLIVEGSVVANKLIFKIGNIKEKEMSINNIILPIETLSKKCINIRQVKIEDSAVLCLSSTVMRNFWINSITDAVLCNLTKVSGKLPEFNYLSEEDEKEEEKEEEEEEQEQEKKKKEEETAETETKQQQNNVKENDNEKKYEKDKEKEMEKKEEEKEPEPEPEPEMKDQEKERVEEKKKDVRTKEEKFKTPLKTTKETQPIDETEKKLKDEKEEEKIKKKILREEFDDDLEREEKEKGLKLRIAKSKYGYAKVKINGKSIDDIKKDEELERTLKNEEKEIAQRVVEDINEMDEIDDF